MKIFKILFYFLLGGIIGFSINFTWSIQQNIITFSVAFILYALAGFIYSKKSIALNSYKTLLLFWYITLLIIYSLTINYSWDLPFLFIECLLSFSFGYYLQTIKSPIKSILFFALIVLVFIGWLYVGVPWISYENKSKIEVSNQKIKFELQCLENNESIVTDSTLKGKVILLDFWYKSCGVCIRQYPKMEAVYNHFKKNNNVAIYFVNNGIDSIETITDFVKNKNIQIPVLIDKNSLLVKKLKLDGFPVFVLIDKKGIIKEIHMGYSRDEANIFEEQTINKIEQLLINK
jgi:peroxiredoxin